jgi:hypothetical protein
MVVVYKIDRLTRSLADFAKLVEHFDAAGCSFVSVTQAFNTSTSMGRLTLNVLLSLAQFEREVTAERIRDKIAASKKKGMWMGGMIPLGYDKNPDPKMRGLVVNAMDAESVRTIFRLYDQHACLRTVAPHSCHNRRCQSCRQVAGLDPKLAARRASLGVKPPTCGKPQPGISFERLTATLATYREAI